MLFVARAERKYARQASTQLLDLYWQQRGAQPGLADRILYEGVVAQRLGPDASRAGETIRRAEESFTDWPVERELQCRHVVHYLMFDEYMRTGKVREETKTNMGPVVANILPEES